MLYVIFGSDENRAYDKFTHLISEFVEKNDARLFRVNALDFDRGTFNELIFGQLLFERKYLVVANKLFENAEAKETVLENTSALEASPNVFIFLETILTTEELKKFEKHAVKIVECKGTKEKREAYNLYPLTDALGSRDRKKLWVLYQKALLAGISEEEIFWKLVWHVRNLQRVVKSKGIEETDLKPFVYQKAKKQNENFTAHEIDGLSEKLSSMYHKTRSEGKEFDFALEQFVLSI